MAKPIVVVTEGSASLPLQWLNDRATVIETSLSDPLLDNSLKVAEGLIIRTYTKVTPAFLAKCPMLRVVGRGGVGVENIDVTACRARGIEVVYTPDANTIAVGDFVFGYILQMLRPWCFFREKAYEPKEFKRVREIHRGKQLNELTLGVLGMGRVGRRVLRLANGFEMKVIYNDLLDVSGELAFPALAVDKDTLYSTCDVLSLHVDMRRGNENLISAKELALMKPEAILINTSRGEVLDVYALAEALKNKRIAGAALDVYSPEPPPADFPLLGFENVLLTPHMAARTDSALENMSWVVKDVMAVLNGEKPQYPVPGR